VHPSLCPYLRADSSNSPAKTTSFFGLLVPVWLCNCLYLSISMMTLVVAASLNRSLVCTSAPVSSSRVCFPWFVLFITSKGSHRSATVTVSLSGSVPDPHPDPQELYVFGPPVSAFGSVIYLHGSGPGYFHQQAKKWRKTLISTVLWLLYGTFFYLLRMM